MADSSRPGAGQRRLRSGQTGNGNPEWRARHAVQPQLVAEVHGPWLSTVLAADPDLEIRTHASAVLDRHPHQLSDARSVEHAERIIRKNALLDIERQEPACVVATQAERGLREVVRAE